MLVRPPSPGTAYLPATRVAGSSNSSPASAPPPPITTSSGSKVLIAFATPIPTCSPQTSIVRQAAGSPSRAAVTISEPSTGRPRAWSRASSDSGSRSAASSPIQPLAQNLPQRDVGERHVHRGDHPAGLELDDRGHPYAHGVQPFAGRLPHHRDELLEQVRAVRERGGTDHGFPELPVAQRRGGHLGAAEVHPDRGDAHRPPAAAGSSRTVSSRASGTSIDAGTCGSGSAPGPNAEATAGAFPSPVTRNTTCCALASAGSVSVTRGTNGSRPDSSTPTTRRERSDSDAWSGNIEAR